MSEVHGPPCNVCGVDWYRHGGMEHDYKTDLVLASTPREPLYLDEEIVICAAVLASDGEVLIRCHRHHDGLRALQDRGLTKDEGRDAFGFVTSRGRYVDRREALQLQRDAGVKSNDPGGYHADELFSEDLY